VSFARVSRPSIVMPAYYDLWAYAVDDPFWTRAARAAREYWKASAHPMTGLMPVRADFDGTPDPNWSNFDSESYRAHFNMALDQIWGEGDPWEVAEAEKLLSFFAGQGGSNNFGTAYKLDGTLVDPLPDVALVAANGVIALIAGGLGNDPFIEEVWGLSTPVGQGRYYSGILGLTAVLILSGQYRVW
jgi:oligosaccharide reducing-end xylanase